MEETALPAYFGEWLKSRRKELDLTQAELARRASCSLPALRKIEAGERRPSRQLAGLLAQSLGIPTEEQPIFIRVARGELNLERLRSPSSFQAADLSLGQTSPAGRIKLPFQTTPFIGREAELAALEKLLADPKCRLLTLSGMGGIGKTRLAVEAAYRQQDFFPGGIYFVPLATLNSAKFIVPAVAEALGLAFSGTLDPREQLLNHLAVRARQAMLLILDNLEHLLLQSDQEDSSRNVIGLLAEVFQTAPKAKILITSRERVSMQGEWTFELQGLPTPSGDDCDGGGNALCLEDYSATALFLQRARQVKGDFKVQPEERAALVRVCQLVEGTPLAIEMAAAWVGILAIHEIAHEISSNLDFLITTMRDAPERHRSLRATFEHSWKLLTTQEQQGLCRLAVFRGGFQREAAERVTGASLSTLLSLFSKSLLLRRENRRYDLHEVVRHYALSYLLEDPQRDATSDRHCRYYLELVQGKGKGFIDAIQWIPVQTLVDELDNLRAAMAWALGKSQPECSLQIATALGQFWYLQGYWREGLEWLEQGLDHPGPVSNIVRAKALSVAGRLVRNLSDYPRAVGMLQESLDLWRKCEDQSGIDEVLRNLGAAVLYQGDCERAADLFEEALSVARTQGDRRGEYRSLDHIGFLASYQGDPQRAIELYYEALALAQQANDENEVAILLNTIGDNLMMIGDYDQAEDCFEQCMTICHKLGNRITAAHVTGNRGYMAMKQGDYTRACDLLADTLFILQELGDKEEAIICFEPLAFIAKELHFPEKATRLLAAAEALRKEIGVPLDSIIQTEREQCLKELRLQLGEPAFEEAWREGSKMTYDGAVSYALDRPWQVVQPPA